MSQRLVPFGPEEFRALKSTIGSYLDYLDQMVGPSAERNDDVTVLEGVYTRLCELVVLGPKGEGQRFWLTRVELAAVDLAVLTVARLVGLVIKPCEQQEDRLLALDKMRWRIRMLVLPPQH
jgi:hypothetical protein